MDLEILMKYVVWIIFFGLAAGAIYYLAKNLGL